MGDDRLAELALRLQRAAEAVAKAETARERAWATWSDANREENEARDALMAYVTDVWRKDGSSNGE